MSTKNPRFSLNGDGKLSDSPKSDLQKMKIIEALNQRYQELNKLWEKAEAELKEIPIPLDVEISYKYEPADPHEPDGYQINYHLGFVRSKGGWRICYGSTHDGNYPDYGWKPITECSMDIRLEAVPHISALRKRVLKAAEECVPKLDKAITDLRNTLQSW